MTEGDDAEPLYQAAIDALEPTDIDVERAARTCSTASGCVAQKRRRDAREQLTAALELFERSAAPRPSPSGRAAS